MFLYEVPGIPVAWAAPRQSNGRFYSPKHYEQQSVINCLRAQGGPRNLTIPLRIDVHFIIPIPKSASKKKRDQMLSGKIQPQGKPDRSNMLKFIEDCIERAGIVKNDSQFCAGETTKSYGEFPKTFIVIQKIFQENNHENSCGQEA